MYVGGQSQPDSPNLSETTRPGRGTWVQETPRETGKDSHIGLNVSLVLSGT